MILYKYLTPDRLNVLRDCRIRFTQPGAFNDLLESRPVIVRGLAAPHEISEVLDDYIKSERLRETYEEDLPPLLKKFLSFEAFAELVRSQKEILGKGLMKLANAIVPSFTETFFSERDKYLGILSLSERPDDILMWSHYCREHTGFVLGFDSDDGFFNQKRSQSDDLRHFRQVAYVDARPSLPAIELDATSIFLTKSKDWEYEREWRMILPLQDGTAHGADDKGFPVYLFDFPPTALRQLILGARIAIETKQGILKVIRQERYSHVEILRTVMHETDWGLKLVRHENSSPTPRG